MVFTGVSVGVLRITRSAPNPVFSYPPHDPRHSNHTTSTDRSLRQVLAALEWPTVSSDTKRPCAQRKARYPSHELPAKSAHSVSNPPRASVRLSVLYRPRCSKRTTATLLRPYPVGSLSLAGVVQWLEPQPSKLMMRVRLPSPALTGTHTCRHCCLSQC